MHVSEAYSLFYIFLQQINVLQLVQCNKVKRAIRERMLCKKRRGKSSLRLLKTKVCTYICTLFPPKKSLFDVDLSKNTKLADVSGLLLMMSAYLFASQKHKRVITQKSFWREKNWLGAVPKNL
jgi:hypothetical protein